MQTAAKSSNLHKHKFTLARRRLRVFATSHNSVPFSGQAINNFFYSLYSIMEALANFAKKNVVMLIALVAAAITSIIVPPDAKYISYFDFRTLTCLFCVLGVVCALKNVKNKYNKTQT